MTNQQYKKRSNKKALLLALLVLVLLIGGAAYWRLKIYEPADKVITTAGNVPKPATSNSSAGTPAPAKNPAGNGQRNISGGTDTNGQSTATTNSSQWIVSKSGNITVQEPIANATIKSGSMLIGLAKVSQVNFRLVDNTAGVISEGTLNVVDGKFSGALNFTPHSSGGRLDVFSTDANGVEINEIQIAVKF